jgi:adenosylhomocysteine nucleosidase
LRTRVGILVGLAAEARLIERAAAGTLHATVVRTGADGARAREGAERLARSGVAALLSFGLAGGLDPALRPGDLILAEGVVLPDGRVIAADPRWRSVLHGAAPHALGGTVAGSDRALSDAADKARLHAATGARAVDMESHALALAAERHGLPFVVIRAVADPAEHGLPAIARVPLRADGTVRLSATLPALLARPGEWPRVARLAGETRAALASLSRAVRPALLAPL